MPKSQAIRWIGFIGSVLSAVALVMQGEIQSAGGVMFAALSSAGVISSGS